MTARSHYFELDVRALASARETAAYHEGGLFPVSATAPGGAIVTVLRGGAGHVGTSGRLDLIRSLDGGATWTPPNVIVDSERDDRNPAFGVSSRGTLVLAYQRLGSYDGEGVYHAVTRDGGASRQPIQVMITRSTDSGLTWETPFPMSVDSLSTASPFGKIVSLTDGTLLMAMYIHDHTGHGMSFEEMRLLGTDLFGSFVARSHDDGVTREDPVVIAAAMDECGLIVLPDGAVLALLRASDPEAALWSSRSGDGGRSWSEPARVTDRRQHPGDLSLLSDGGILLCYGNRSTPYRIEGRVSRDGGRSWLERRLLFSGPLYGYDIEEERRTDLGYPSTAFSPIAGGRRGVTTYYYNPSLPRTGDLEGDGRFGPLYSAANYRAVAVSWDESELLASLDR